MADSFTSEYVSHHRRVADALQKENEDLSGENIRLRRCLLLLQENAELKTVTAMTSVLSSGDRKLRDFLTDAILNYGTKNSTANHFRPISTSPYHISRENTSPVVSKMPSSRVTPDINSSSGNGRFGADNINQYEPESELVHIPFREYDTSNLRTQLYQSDIPKDTEESQSDQEPPRKSVSPRGNMSDRMERRKYMMPSPNRESATPEVDKPFSRSPSGPKSYAWRKQTSSPVKNLLTGKMALRKSVSPGSVSPRKLTKIRELSPARELFEPKPNADKRKYISTADDMFVDRANVMYAAPTTLRPTDMSAAEGVQPTRTVFNKTYLSGRKSVPPNIDIFTDRMDRVKSYSPSRFLPVERLAPSAPTRPTIIPQYGNRKMTSMQRSSHSPSEGSYYRSYSRKTSPLTLQESDPLSNALTPYNQDFQRKEGTIVSNFQKRNFIQDQSSPGTIIPTDTLSYNQHDVAEINSQSMRSDTMKSSSVTSTGDKDQGPQTVGSTRQQSPSSRYYGDQGPSAQSATESEGYVSQMVHDASQPQGGYYNAVGNPVAASTPIRPASTSLNKHIENILLMDACSTHSLEQLLGLKGEDANKRAKSILFRPVDKICGQHPIITRSLKNSLSTMKPNMRLVGEIAFQLDRRILDHVFTEVRSLHKKSKSNHRFYGFSISTIYQMMHKIAKKGNRFDNNIELEMRLKFEKMLVKLSSFGYIYDLHADFTQDMVNKYGLLNGPPDQLTIKGFGLDNPLVLRVLLAQLIRDRQELYDMLIILDCLCFLSHEDGKPLFIW